MTATDPNPDGAIVPATDPTLGTPGLGPATEANPWRPEVIADSTGKWFGNGLSFATAQEAADWAHDLSLRWLLVRAYRARNALTGEVFGERYW